MENKIYQCRCGKIFNNSQKFNGHKSHCLVHQIQKHKTLDNYKRRQHHAQEMMIEKGVKVKQEKINKAKQTELENWLNERHTCEYCGNLLTRYYGTGRFCNVKCARGYSTCKNRKETTAKLEQTLASKQKQHIDEYYQNPKRCIVCNQILPYKDRSRKICRNEECRHKINQKSGHTGGLKSSSIQNRRSKHEIEFCNMCINYFGKENILHNIQMFNGWDADIIIPKYKLAILWDGPWHFRKVTEGHNLEQVQYRDRCRIQEIRNCGYRDYIIRDDDTEYNKDIVQEEFNKLIRFISS